MKQISGDIEIHVVDETSPLATVILGIGTSPGAQRGIDAKAKESKRLGIYPSESEMIKELNGFERLLCDNGVTVLRPQNIDGLNQVFVRDIGFVIDDVFIRSRMAVPDRQPEPGAIDNIVKRLKGDIIEPPEDVLIEGGDVMLHDGHIFVGVGTRTNEKAVSFLENQFGKGRVTAFNLVDSDDPALAALHLDCVFQPVGSKNALLFAGGFAVYPAEIDDFFGSESIIKFDGNELSDLYCNIFSISKDLVVSCDTFTSLNECLKDIGITVKTVAYEKIGLMGGLLRCSTLPLCRTTPSV